MSPQNKSPNVLIADADNEIISFAKLVEVVAITGKPNINYLQLPSISLRKIRVKIFHDIFMNNPYGLIVSTIVIGFAFSLVTIYCLVEVKMEVQFDRQVGGSKCN